MTKPEIKYEILHENVYYFPGIIENIDHLLEEIEVFSSRSVAPWGTWYANNTPDSYAYGNVKTFETRLLADEVDPQEKERAEYLINSILNAMNDSCSIFLSEHGADESELNLLTACLFEDKNVYGIRKYNPGESMGPHQDMVDEERDTLTISVYLNDDYEGGEIAVVEPGAESSVKAKAGSILIFPSSYLHESKLLTAGRKTIITHVHMTAKKLLQPSGK